MTTTSANSSATCTSNSSPSNCHASAVSSAVIDSGVPPPPSVVNVGAPPPSSVVNIGPPASSNLLKETGTKPWFWALLFALLLTFILLICLYLIVNKKRQLKQCFTGSNGKYDVFLSFRGGDTRDNFLSFLRDALKEKNVRAFIDENMEKGSEITPEINEKIEDSKISIVIFSENYASSPWCLSELVKIVHCMKKNRQIVIPVFYRIDPSDVLNLTGSFGTAMKTHEESKEISEDEVQIWKDCLKKVAKLSGWDSNFTKPENELIKKIANDASKKLKRRTSVYKPSRVSDDIELGVL